MEAEAEAVAVAVAVLLAYMCWQDVDSTSWNSIIKETHPALLLHTRELCSSVVILCILICKRQKTKEKEGGRAWGGNQK
jgi:hypothetical protein